MVGLVAIVGLMGLGDVLTVLACSPCSPNNTSITIINYYIIELSHLKSFLSLFIYRRCCFVKGGEI